MSWQRFSMVGVLALACGLAISGASAAADHPSAADPDEPALRKQSLLYRAAATGKARTFLTAAYVAGLTETLRSEGPFTVFVPTDQAFANLPESALTDLLKLSNKKTLADILKYHVVPGRILAAEITKEPRPKTVLGPRLTIAANSKGVAVDEATIVRTDLIGRNGVVHFIDRVLTPPAADVVGVAEKAGQFTILLKAAEAAGLLDALRDSDKVTVLAPTDEAFGRLGEATIKALLKDKAKLAQVLKYHVIPGKVEASDLLEDGAKTLLGPPVNARIKGGRLVVAQGGVPFLDTDIPASNGLIHVIDRVLMPPAGHH